MSIFDEQPDGDPHGECAAEIHRLEARVAELSGGDRLSLEWNSHLEEILGRVCFRCANIANILRKGGANIPNSAEHEQAHAIHFLLTMYAKHGDGWAVAAENALRAILDVPPAAPATAGGD